LWINNEEFETHNSHPLDSSGSDSQPSKHHHFDDDSLMTRWSIIKDGFMSVSFKKQLYKPQFFVYAGLN